jgi:hypothetical protein
VLFLVGDHILRHTVQLEMGPSQEDSAAAIALRRGVDQIEEIVEASQMFPGIKVQMLPISQIVATPEFKWNYSWIENMESDDDVFSHSLSVTAMQYLETYASQGRHIKVSEETAVFLCRRYLKEELAAFGVVHQWGWIVDVYPGPELPVLLEIARGRYPGAPSFLMKRRSVSLEYVRRQQAPSTSPEACDASFQPTC